MIFWEDGTPWSQVNDYIYSRALLTSSGDLDIASVEVDGRNLHAYAKWLEEEHMDWRHWPALRADRALVKYRGALIAARKAGALAGSTVTSRQRSAIHFYFWVARQGILPGVDLEMVERVITLTDQHGFLYRKLIVSSELAIRSSARKDDAKTRLEGGASAVSGDQQAAILRVAKRHAPYEVYLMLRVGFECGLRLGSISDLKIQTIERAVPMSGTTNVVLFAIGPGASPPVATKFHKTGFDIPMPTALRDELLEYSFSQRRQKRELLAKPENKDLLFLTKGGRRYAASTVNRSATMNSAMVELRSIAKAHGVDMGNFNFHWTRATFPTGYAEIGIENCNLPATVAFLKRVMLHAREETTWRYIQWVQTRADEAALANEFTREVYGRTHPLNEVAHA
jgi:integrase